MVVTLRLLIVEDSPYDAELAVAVLEAAGYTCVWQRVETRQEFVDCLGVPDYDLVLADYSLPSFNGQEALQLFRASGLDIPFIFVSGALGEEIAIDSLKAGATDYVMKDRLARLAPVVQRALVEYEEKRQRAQMEERLRRSEARYRSLLENALQGMCVYQDGIILLANAAMARLYGYDSPEDLIGQSYWSLLPPRARQRMERDRTGRWRSEQVPAVYEAEHIKKDGTTVWVQISATVIPWEGDSAMLVTCLDLTERKRAEERFQIVARATNDAVWDWDLTTQAMWWNEGVQTLFGYAAYEVEPTATWWFARIHPDDRDRVMSDMRALLDSGTQNWADEHRFCRADGSYAEVFDRGYVLYDDAGKPVRMIGAMIDISERRQAAAERQHLQEQLFQAQKMESIGTLAGGVAHDFNNLLTVILGNLHLIREGLPPDDVLQPRVADIDAAATRAAALTRQLLAFSRRQHLERKVIALDDTLNNFMRMLRRIIGEDVTVHLHTGPQAAPVFADPAQMEQLVMNLAVNARDAMPDGGQLTIDMRHVELDEAYIRTHADARPGPYVQLTVSDTGCGMDVETQQRIFEPFFTTKELGKGTGLGLAVVYGIVKQHDGLIDVDSEVGRGTTFNIYLPAVQPGHDVLVEQRPPAPRRGTETILVAEDEEALRTLVQNILTRLGYTVLLARDGEEAVQMYTAQRERIAMLLLDVVMPHLGGREAYERIRDLGGNVPVLFVTGYSAGMASVTLDMGAEAEVIQKPYDVRELGHKVRDILDRSRGKAQQGRA